MNVVAPEFFGAGLKLVPSASAWQQAGPALLATELLGGKNDVHSVQPAAVSITSPPKPGRSIRCRKSQRLPGFAASTRSGCTWTERALPTLWCRGLHAGGTDLEGSVDVLSFGATKNGAINAEALVVFDDALWKPCPSGASGQGTCCPRCDLPRHRCMRTCRTTCGWQMPDTQCDGSSPREGLTSVRGVEMVAPA